VAHDMRRRKAPPKHRPFMLSSALDLRERWTGTYALPHHARTASFKKGQVLGRAKTEVGLRADEEGAQVSAPAGHPRLDQGREDRGALVWLGAANGDGGLYGPRDARRGGVFQDIIAESSSSRLSAALHSRSRARRREPPRFIGLQHAATRRCRSGEPSRPPLRRDGAWGEKSRPPRKTRAHGRDGEGGGEASKPLPTRRGGSSVDGPDLQAQEVPGPHREGDVPFFFSPPTRAP